jgi:hypothetical protein
LGAVLWGLFIGAQSRLLDCWASRFARTPSRVVFVVLLSLVIALPINSGSLDFSFSIDIIFLAILMMLFFRARETGLRLTPRGLVSE